MPAPIEVQCKEESFVFVVTGASGNLALNKLFPALLNMHISGFLPPMTSIIGYGRTVFTNESFREFLVTNLKGCYSSLPTSPVVSPSKRGPPSPSSPGPLLSPTSGEETLEEFVKMCTYVVTKDSYGEQKIDGEDSFAKLNEEIEKREASFPQGKKYHRIFYLALPYTVYPSICSELKKKCSSSKGSTRVVLEKPFGRDLHSAFSLNKMLSSTFQEEEMYRIDRYLGKEIVQNIMVMRFANRFLAPIWNRENIANVQIMFKEPFGVEEMNRARYYDQQGVVRDVIQNHLLQVLALVAMETPTTLSPEDIRDEKLKVLRCVTPVQTNQCVLGQYTAGKDHAGYREDPNTSPDSQTPTFAMMLAYINNERWDGVPFIMKAGKGLNEKRSEIRIQLRQVPGDLFEGQHGPNEIVVRMQPTEEMYMKVTIKKPGLGMNIVNSEMELSEGWKQEQMENSRLGLAPRRAYERLLLNIMHGEQSHFVRSDELLAAWRICDPVLQAMDNHTMPVYDYPFGSRGPKEAEYLRQSTGHKSSIVPKDNVPMGSMEDLTKLNHMLDSFAIEGSLSPS